MVDFGWVISERRFFRKIKRKRAKKAAIWHRCEEEALAVLIHPKDVCLPKIGAPWRAADQDCTGSVWRTSLNDALPSVCRCMCVKAQECVQWRTSVLCLTNCCSHQPVWRGKEGIRGAAVTHSLLAAGRTWETSPTFVTNTLIALYFYDVMTEKKKKKKKFQVWKWITSFNS